MNRATKMYCRKFTVEGKGRFPYDMLRYDSCFPSSPEDVAGLDPNNKDRRSVTLYSYRTSANWQPTTGRWSNFLWAACTAVEL